MRATRAPGHKFPQALRAGRCPQSDTAVERITGQSHAGDIAVEIGLLMTPGALFADEDIPALLAGYGPLPAAIGRQLAAGSKAWLRRLFTDPATGDLTTRDNTRRRFDGPLAGFIRERDQHCGRPWCDCRIRDLDHIDPYNGANTTANNAQGLCKRSHTTKHLPLWQVEATKSGSVWTTPTGHRYDTTRPRLGGDSPTPGKPKILTGESTMEYKLSKTIGCGTLHRRQ